MLSQRLGSAWVGLDQTRTTESSASGFEPNPAAPWGIGQHQTRYAQLEAVLQDSSWIPKFPNALPAGLHWPGKKWTDVSFVWGGPYASWFNKNVG
eukprot:scaffold30280_cov23-Tisochrysis_lutea.AAC.5